MKYFAWILGALALVAILLAASLATRRTESRSDCSGRITIVKGPDGTPMECVCEQGALAACFKPGP
jgi:hypothetical protein